MTARTPLIYDSGDIRQVNETELNTLISSAALEWFLDQPITLTVDNSSSEPSIGTMFEEYYFPGTASVSTTSFATKEETADPGEQQTIWSNVIQSNDSTTAPSDTNSIRFPAYYDGNDILAMSYTDFCDTFIYPAITRDVMSSFAQPYVVSTSNSLSNYTSLGIIFEDYYTDINATSTEYPVMNGTLFRTRYYLHKRDSYSRSEVSPPEILGVLSDGDLQLKDFRDDFRAAIRNESRKTGGVFINYSIANSSIFTEYFDTLGSIITDNARVESTLRNYQQNDNYYSQEYPSGSLQAQNRYALFWGRT